MMARGWVVRILRRPARRRRGSSVSRTRRRIPRALRPKAAQRRQAKTKYAQAPLSAETAARPDSFSAPERRRRQNRTAALHPRGISPTGFMPPQPTLLSALNPVSIQKRRPRRPRLRRREACRYGARLRPLLRPDDVYLLPNPFRERPERRPAPDEGAVRTRNQLAGGLRIHPSRRNTARMR